MQYCALIATKFLRAVRAGWIVSKCFCGIHISPGWFQVWVSQVFDIDSVGPIRGDS